ncbi:Pex2-Pex12 domain containing protein [Pyrenophora tritici-repentis]|uniref:Pex2-Pex12 domain containing protein n=2 Tax=Pyrenophora tritici-repentis TaxID=45151 RepID=A0A2W1EGC2_9PLEO|nr:peroxisomal biogenesis factor 2 [Pyrenophora tritici-repentis Pt-1C-BFP]KAA8621283.1 Pex2-Pex12 domain-containing protein [Pyrenophora tritici-repentis]EDU43666.1 peroxisomal biogenesis factor 2 [Pyrenophora tritici-repentis Pt-1C-BFP]KAF7450517.1 Pex2 Pex12 domain containing protein [Pyrenophora tritici-repentis]KAF7573135.1 Pex2-Pex12 multi-domain protein [Pyrenophora tritici-repentis]KAG9381263.1 Pex2 Pex12 domain containing protein [Pyrenophora tritici-repentis]
MPAADFAAAQQRIAARRAQRALQQQSRQHEVPRTVRALSRLPFPFSTISTTGFSVWDAIKGRTGTRPEFRVGQVDAELLDEELLSLLKGQVGEGLKYFGSHITDNYSAEILLVLRAILWKLSIWDQNASYGAHLQGLRYTDARSNAPNRPPPKPWQKVAYGAITVGGRYAWTKWEDYLLSASEDYTRPESTKLKMLGRLSELAGSAHDMFGLASFLVFLVDGRYRTITDRLLRLRLTPTSHATSREVSFEYLNRQLVWHAFTEFLLFLLPLVGISRWRRILSRTFRKFQSTILSLLGRSKSTSSDNDEEKASGELGFLPERTCAICYRDQNPTTASEADILASSAGGGGVVGSAATDITNPYEAMPCGCIYCFACIAQRIANEEGEGWTCLRCGETVKECQPWNGDIIEEPTRTVSHHHHADEHERPSTAKSVVFATSHGRDNTADLDEKALLREVDPMPEQEDGARAEDEAHRADIMATTHSRGLDLGESLFTESSEWARASEDQSSSSSSEDEQSEEYEEDEEEEGEESGFYH